MSDHAEIRAIVERRQPELVALLDHVLGGPATDEEIEEILDILVDELLDSGLDEDDEHNDYGRRVETLIDVVNRRRPGY